MYIWSIVIQQVSLLSVCIGRPIAIGLHQFQSISQRYAYTMIPCWKYLPSCIVSTVPPLLPSHVLIPCSVFAPTFDTHLLQAPRFPQHYHKSCSYLPRSPYTLNVLLNWLRLHALVPQILCSLFLSSIPHNRGTLNFSLCPYHPLRPL